MEALKFWRLWPRQIASDLRRFFPGCRISQWHSEEMSSRELLELFGVTITEDPETRIRTIEVEWPPEEGAVAAAMRDGERSEWKQMLAQTANISALFRAMKMPKADIDVYGERFFLPVARMRLYAEEQQAVATGGVIMFPGEEG